MYHPDVQKTREFLRSKAAAGRVQRAIRCVKLGSKVVLCDVTEENKSRLLDDSKVTALFMGLEDSYTHIRQEYDRDGPDHRSACLQISDHDMNWLSDVVHPALWVALGSETGYHASFVTDDALHIVVQLPYKGHLNAAFSLRLDLKNEHALAVFASSFGSAMFRRSQDQAELDCLRFAERLAHGVSGFQIVVDALEMWHEALLKTRARSWANLMQIESATGRGALFSRASGGPTLMHSDDIAKVHRCISQAASDMNAIDYQAVLVNTMIDMHSRYSELVGIRQPAIGELLAAQKSRTQGLQMNLRLVQERLHNQLALIDVGVGQNVAAQSAASSRSTTILAVVATIFLPCGLVAQVLDLDYFTVDSVLVLNASIASLSLILIVSVLITLAVCLSCVVCAKLWRRRQEMMNVRLNEMVDV